MVDVNRYSDGYDAYSDYEDNGYVDYVDYGEHIDGDTELVEIKPQTNNNQNTKKRTPAMCVIMTAMARKMAIVKSKISNLQQI